MINRRRMILRGSLGLGLAVLTPSLARPQAGSLFNLKDDKGQQVYNYRLPSDLTIEGLPGVLWTGSATPDVVLVEFFDYNCPLCRVAAADLQGLLAREPALRLGLVNNAVLSAGSVQAAKLQQAVLRAYGPVKAYAFHQRLYASHGPVDGPIGLAAAKDLGLDVAALETAGDLPQVGAVVRRQRDLAEALGFLATPSFMLGSTGILGYPGPQAMTGMVEAFRRCEKLVCV